MYWKIAPHCAWQIIDGEAVIVDLENGKTVGLNETGSFVWSRLKTTDHPTIIRELVAATGVEIERAQRDVEEFLQNLNSRGLISPEN